MTSAERELAAVAFDAGSGRWSVGGTCDGLPSELTVASQNVWFAPFHSDARWTAILAEMRHLRPDVIAFQEVTPEFLERVLVTPWIREQYWSSDVDGSSFTGYGVLLLLRRAPRVLTLYDLPSAMGRKLLVAELAPGLAVATVHLESLPPSASTRDAQFEIIVDTLAPYPDAILIGDLNFCSSWREENARIPSSFLDAWAELQPDQPGYTEDTALNPMLLAKEGHHKQVRYDRALIRSVSWRAQSIELINHRPIGQAGHLFASDHFGLVARFSR